MLKRFVNLKLLERAKYNSFTLSRYKLNYVVKYIRNSAKILTEKLFLVVYIISRD